MTQNQSTSYAALNSYSNGSCQVFFQFPTSFDVVDSPNSTLYLFQSLPNRTIINNTFPCCSNLTWLLSKVKTATKQPTQVISQPTFLVIDDNNYIVTVSQNDTLIQMNPKNLTIMHTATVKSQSRSLSYVNGLYYVGSGNSTSYALDVYYTKNVSLVTDLSGPSSYFGAPKQAVFLYNNTVMVLVTQLPSNSSVLFYQINSSINYTLINKLVLNISVAYGLSRIDDYSIYLTTSNSNSYIYKLSTTGILQEWTLTQFAGRTTAGNTPAGTAIDSCNRLWVIMKGAGVWIYDQTGILIGTWSGSTTLSDIVVTIGYNVYLADNGNNKIWSYQPNIQCTS
ncbi:unnamed protein product [Didymodactylos carnosus]|uniref:Uncharacterized protein n=1 Tax=Didymodactylos carnosus TaxID=1234261 RepID=A0A815LCS1_9BILA|nr:unnamed protein product [Didymodactylos carnosus]CAF1407532.1 unnamed protein product [Didymodactylos carnosus]CAF3685621.1 unnamed protein product [Didymodactylos carnosus]CAF4298070.1 unnamed protein product [Didymodactylos carnosus]